MNPRLDNHLRIIYSIIYFYDKFKGFLILEDLFISFTDIQI